MLFSLPRLTVLTPPIDHPHFPTYRFQTHGLPLTLPTYRSQSSPDFPFSLLRLTVLNPLSPDFCSLSPDLQLSLPRLTVLTPRLTVLTPPTYSSHYPDLRFSLPDLPFSLPRLTVLVPLIFRSHSPHFPFSLPPFSVLTPPTYRSHSPDGRWNFLNLLHLRHFRLVNLLSESPTGLQDRHHSILRQSLGRPS